MKTIAAVCRAKHAPLILEELEIDAPQDDEVLVKVKFVGICHTDIAMRDQVYPVPQPIVLGHEGAGVIEQVGSAVKNFSIGDAVLMSFDSCGHCPACLSAKPGFCDSFYSYNFAGLRQDASTALRKGNEKIHSNFFGQSSFATYALASPRNLVKLQNSEGMEYFAPLGCGIQTGAGAVLNALKVEAGDTFAVFGVGSVALSAVMAARVAGASIVVAVGRSDSKLELAQKVGATHTINSTVTKDVVKAIREITGRGMSHSLDTSGVPSIIKQAVECLGNMGKCAVLGAAPVGTEVSFDYTDLMIAGKTIMGTIEGNCVPQNFIPILIDLYRQGRFPIDKIISFYPFEDINRAIEDAERGHVFKAVLRM